MSDRSTVKRHVSNSPCVFGDREKERDCISDAMYYKFPTNSVVQWLIHLSRYIIWIENKFDI